MDVFEQRLCDGSETESVYSDDSSEDPSFDVTEVEARVAFSNLSVKRNPKIRDGKKSDEKMEDYAVIESVVPELDEQSKKTYETVQKIIEDGRVEKLKLEECKVYLRTHGLRLSGNKETLILRIKEHIDILNGGGEIKYPPSSFVLNCKGDACMGDVVMFEQNVYEEFSIVSRSAKGPSCGTRTVSGRIVKESYGAAKQQHTFTIEVLWSKGVKPLPPLRQLLIKGRNLYRLKTMRQRWDNEAERQKILSEKHNRGGFARLDREARIQEKEMRKAAHQQARNRKQEPKRETTGSPFVMPENPIKQQLPQRYINPQNYLVQGFPQLPHQRQPLASMYHGFPTSSEPTTFRHVNDSNLYPTSSEPTSFRHVKDKQVCHEQRMNYYKEKQVCWHYARGMCYYGDRCKFVHE